MRAALQYLLTAAVVLFPASTCAAGIHRGPATRDSTWTRSPVVITPADRVRIQTVTDPARVPVLLRGKFAGSIAGMNHSTLTIVLASGEPAVVHRDLVDHLEVRVDHGSMWKHLLVGAGIGICFGALVGVTSGDDTPDELFELNKAESTLLGMILFTPCGAIIGAALPSGESWKAVPLERVEWSPTPARPGVEP